MVQKKLILLLIITDLSGISSSFGFGASSGLK